MDYTLDSVTHAINCLKEQYDDYRIDKKSVLYSGQDLKKLEEREKRYFFGVLTCSQGVKANLMFNQNDLITVDPGSQIILMFSAASFVDDAGLAIEPKGLFRGFEINVLPL